MFALMDLVMRAGLPGISPELLQLLRVAAGVGSAGLAVAYVANLVAERRRGRHAGAIKLALALSTASLYTFSGLVTTNLLLGGAVFEVFHAAQYFAIVWYFNRRLEDRVGDEFGPLRFLFRDRWSSLLIYLFAIAAFGSLFLVVGTPQYGPIRAAAGSSNTVYLVFSAFFVTSSLLHYYYDGFIWKIHDRDTGSTLGLSGPGLSEMSVPALLHFGKWAALALGVGVVIALEVSTPASAERQAARIQALSSLTPEVPELRRQLMMQALGERRTSEALGLAEKNVALRPRSHAFHADLGRVQLALGDWPAAESAYRDALRLHPTESVYQVDLARSIAHQGGARMADAAASFREAIEARPHDSELPVELALVELRGGNAAEATSLLEPLLVEQPDSVEVRTLLIESLIASEQPKRALEVARGGVELQPDSARAERSLGISLRAMQRWAGAAGAFSRAWTLDPTLPGLERDAGVAWFKAGRYPRAEPHLLAASRSEQASPNIHFSLGVVHLKSDRRAEADASFAQFISRAPDVATGYRTLAGRLAQHSEPAAAIRAWHEAIRLEPDHAASHFKLASLLSQQGEREAAGRELQEASRLGLAVPPTVWADLAAPRNSPAP
jgi:tetratricopeptide (TPR) repeat protein